MPCTLFHVATTVNPGSLSTAQDLSCFRPVGTDDAGVEGIGTIAIGGLHTAKSSRVPR